VNRLNFTMRSLESLPTPKAKRVTYYDAKTRGLGLLIQPSAHRAFFWFRKVRGYPRWHTIGTFPDLTIENARARADELNAELANWKAADYVGQAPKLEKRTDLTLKTLHDDYCARHLRAHAKNPERAENYAKGTFDLHLAPWKDRKIGSISRQNVGELHAAVAKKAGEYAANRVLQNLRAVINWAIKQEIWTGENPATRIQQFHEKKRTRFLQPEEVAKLFAVLRKESNKDVADFVLLALLTGARKSNVTAMRWDQVTLETSSWEIPDPKNREPYRVALVKEVVEILKRRKTASSESPWVFPSHGPAGHVKDFKRSWAQVLKRAEIENFRQHDLRRTLGAWQASQGASLQMIGKSLGHKSLAASAIYSPMNLDAVRSSVTAATSAMFRAKLPRKPRTKLPAAKDSRKLLKAAQR
jgi:integrase